MNRKKAKKGALALSAALASVFMVHTFSELPVSVSAATVLSVSEITEQMGVGWNLGNSLDAHNQEFSSSNIRDYETQWSNPVVTKSLIDKVKAKGFNTVRIPITWYQHISTDSSYTIDPDWMNRVKEVVDYAYNNGMYVIINVHHETWINRADFDTAEASMEAQLRAVWKQIAAAFADYDQHLIFEGMNEPRAVGGSINEWVGNGACYNVVNQLNAAFVDTVRSVESPYRQTRMLMVPDYAASRESYIYAYLTVPKASGSIDADNDGDDDYVAVSLHAYSPYNFAMGDGDHSDFSSAYETELEGMFSAMQAKFLQEGVSIVLGEFSASNYGYDDARLKWAEAYMSNATEYGIPCVLWDNNVESNGGSEAHGYINRSTGEWYTSGGKVVDKLISTRKNTEWGTKTCITYPMYTHNDFSSGSYVSVVDKNIKVSDLSGFGTGKELAIKYTGNIDPVLALMNDTNWGGWTELSPYDYDKDKGIAYFSYDQIMKTWNTANGRLGYLKLNNMDSIGYSGVTLLTIPEQTAGTDFKVTENPASKSVYACQQVTLSAAASAQDLSYTWLISRDNGATWSTANKVSENGSSAGGTTKTTAVFSLANNNVNDRDTVLFRCDFTDGKKTVSTSSAKITVLSRNAAVSVGSVKNNSASISWQANPYAVSYNVYRVQNSSFSLMGSYTGTSCTLTGLTPETEYEIIVSAVYSGVSPYPYNYNSVKFTTLAKSVNDMTISECISYANSLPEDTAFLTDEQLAIIERVLAYDNSK